MYFLYLSIEFSTEIDMSIKKIKSKENNIIKNKNSKFSFKDLNSIRSRIDLIDDNIHELLINRAKLVEKVAKTKKSLMEKSLGLYRPDREHAILKRIISNHKGTFHVRSLVASWSELFSGYRSMQGNLTISFINPLAPVGDAYTFPSILSPSFLIKSLHSFLVFSTSLPTLLSPSKS